MKRKPLIIIAAILMLLFFLALVTLAQENEPVTEAAERQQAAPGAILANMGTAFTYQGSLVDDSNQADGIYDFQFSLFDAVTVGSQISVTQTIDNINVSEGLFTVGLDFGTDAFNGQARWLEIAVKRDADGSYTSLTPRTALTPAPHALALPGLWTQQNATSPNLIGGYDGNEMGTGVTGGVIAGGGESASRNRVYDNYSTVGGGRGNAIGIDDGDVNNQAFSTVGGGVGNTSSGSYATVGGGYSNETNANNATIGGGYNSIASGNSATVGGGTNNLASGASATIGGGTNNSSGNNAATVSGGGYNNASGSSATVGGGSYNTADGSGSTVGGGELNTASGSYTTVGGGSYNLAEADYATIAGGGSSEANPVTTGNRVYDDFGTVGGGGGNWVGFSDGNSHNQISATVSGGLYNGAEAYSATVGGGSNNTASGSLATLGGGAGNIASGYAATVGGGYANRATASYATIAGGGPDFSINNRVYDDYGTVGGGGGNVVGVDDSYSNTQSYATISGGGRNTASGQMSTVGGGNNNTASGSMATLGGGYYNTAKGNTATVGGGQYSYASGDWATVGGGLSNYAGGDWATVPGGQFGNATHYGELAYASGRFAVAESGTAQTSLYVLRQETGDAVLTELFLDGSSERITLAADRVLTFDILVVGTHRFGGSAGGYQVTGVIKNIGGTTSFVGTPVVTVLAEDVASWDVQVTADNTLDALVIKVQGANATTIRWVASVRTVEVGR